MRFCPYSWGSEHLDLSGRIWARSGSRKELPLPITLSSGPPWKGSTALEEKLAIAQSLKYAEELRELYGAERAQRRIAEDYRTALRFRSRQRSPRSARAPGRSSTRTSSKRLPSL